MKVEEGWTYKPCPCGDPACNKFIIDRSGANGMFDENEAVMISLIPDMVKTINDLMTVVGYLMPGIGGISIPDYALLNSAQVDGQTIMTKVKGLNHES